MVCSITAQQYGRFLIDVFEERVRGDVGEVHQTLTSPSPWVGEPPSRALGDVRACVVLEHTVYWCDHFVEPHKLGNITQQHMLELVASDQQRQFGLDKRGVVPRYCLECDVRFACHGGCPNTGSSEPDGDPGSTTSSATATRCFMTSL